MFEEIMGLPAHPLIVHTAVVFVPLLIGFALVYAFVPGIRKWVTWAVIGLAVITPFTAWFATLSGDALQARLLRQGMTGEIVTQIEEHQAFGDRTLWSSIGLAVAALLLVGVTTRFRRTGTSQRVISIVLTVVLVVLAGVTAYYVFKTGDTGARAVWGTT